MDFSFGSLVCSMLVTGVGFVFFKYGRKRSRPMFLIFGIAMMIYPYFIDNVYWMLGIAAAISGVLYYLNNSL